MKKPSVYSVSQINSYIGGLFNEDFLLQSLSIKGEVSNLKYHTSGHIYFTLKDEGGQLSAVMFSGNRKGLSFSMKDGDKVIARGSVRVYEKGGKYQLYANEIEKDGQGELFLRYEALKEELLSMGMFDPMYKKEIKRFIKSFGIVTAEGGAAVRDMIRIANQRNPFVSIFLCPAKVQGEGAAESIANGIRRLDKLNLDAIIIGRGGGSFEDLFAFNEREVAEAVFSCNTPVISAVGHETDTVISDFVADLRASTPSHAIELLVYDIEELLSDLSEMEDSLLSSIKKRINLERRVLSEKERLILSYSPERRLLEKKELLKRKKKELLDLINKKKEDKRIRLSLLSQKIDMLSPLKRMEAGYSYLRDENEKNISSIKQVKKGDVINLTLKDGYIDAEVKDVKEDKKIGKG